MQFNKFSVQHKSLLLIEERSAAGHLFILKPKQTGLIKSIEGLSLVQQT